ncbi:hypothetical protein FGO68_gene12228 [Halteria grandinella]|uniref:Uncharacterized protein n=1 Tax=Halteria grandinella TaxID=5974 RepID=A0A8J8NH09_HALGN|nr:hypothetical protein FGO68_gene12228 [Halteria grandinella]
MNKELQDVADMQRKRLKKVIDPLKSLVALDTIGYQSHLMQRCDTHGIYARDAIVLRTNFPYLLAASLPLAYLTKSLIVPTAYCIGSLYYLLYRSLAKDDCFFCRPALREMPGINIEGLSLEEMHERRGRVMRRLFMGKSEVKSLEDISRVLDKEIKAIQELQ